MGSCEIVRGRWIRRSSAINHGKRLGFSESCGALLVPPREIILRAAMSETIGERHASACG
jgi:hypothetical protein